MIPLFQVRMASDAGDLVNQVLSSGYIGQGQKVEEFEKLLGTYLSGMPITVNAATSGLTLALRLIKDDLVDFASERDEVLTQPITCTATNWPILANGLKIRWVDTDPNTCNMDLNDLRRKIGPKTAAIMLTHWGGYPNDMDVINDEIVDGHFEDDIDGYRVPIIEDAAHAFGSTYKYGLLAESGNFVVYSFQAIKHLTTGDGGALICPKGEQIEKARLLRWYGLDRTKGESFRCAQDVQDWGYKFHMNDIAASIGIANFHLAKQSVKLHQANGEYYNKHLQNIPGITLLENKEDRRSAYWIYTLKAENRDGLMAKLAEQGIASGLVHARNDKHTCVKEFSDPDLPGTDFMSKHMLCIPVGWWVTEEDRSKIVDVIRSGW